MSAALHSYDRLLHAGFSDDQARAILDAMSGDLVTREYLDAKLDAKLASLKNELIVWMVGLATTLLGVQVTLFVVLLSRIHA